MKPRPSRLASEQSSLTRSKAEAPGPTAQRNQVQMANQQSNTQAIRKRRSSINVYDQPSSLNSRLRQLETDMLRLDEDRSKLFDDTHTQLAQYDLKLNEIHAILKSRQDNVEKYVEDMKVLVQAKEEFERQTKALNDRYERIHEKFMHRETTVSRDIKLIKSKFDLLEKNRQFRSILQKSNTTQLDSLESNEGSIGNSGTAIEAVPGSNNGPIRSDDVTPDRSSGLNSRTTRKKVLFNLTRVKFLGKLLSSFHGITRGGLFKRRPNKVSNNPTVEHAESSLADVKSDTTTYKYSEDHELQTSKHNQLDVSES